ncbi:MAG: galactokinase [Actinobacteria bacterium]|nr:galactokinase [Actinomycetota bacterium]
MEADVYFAPGRVNLIGEHTDYNGGLVLPLAIAEGTYVMIRSREAPPARLYSASTGEEAEFDPGEIAPRGDWADYVRGVFAVLAEDRGTPPPFEALYFGDLPLGAGLSSSASMEVVTATAFASLGFALDAEEAARAGWRAENQFVGVYCGIMDQYAVALAEEGTVLFLDCGTVIYRHIPFTLKDDSIVIAHTGVYRSLAASAYNQRRRECEEALRAISETVGNKSNLGNVTREELVSARPRLTEAAGRRAEHVVEENLRVKEAVLCLEGGDPEGLGELLNLSHASLRDLYRVSSPELDTMQEISLDQPGVWGCRMTGAGFGGCVISLVRSEAVPGYLARVPDIYRGATGREPFFITVDSPGGGARKLQARW